MHIFEKGYKFAGWFNFACFEDVMGEPPFLEKTYHRTLTDTVKVH
jgi:hypothetical protein